MEVPVKKPRDKTLLRADELDQLPAIEWLIPGKLLRRGLNVLYGASESCKTLLALYWALVVAQTSPVIFIAGEGLYGLDQRLKAASDYFALSLDNIYVWREAVEIMRASSVSAFIKEVSAVKPALIEIDTLSRCLGGGDENASTDMGQAIQSCNLIERSLDCSVLLLHHKGRKNSYERGHTSLRGAADLMIEVNRNGSLITIKCSKSKDAEPFPNEQYRLTKHLASVVLCAENSVTASELKILKALDQTLAPLAKLLRETGIPRATLLRALAKLKTSGHVSQPTSKGKYELTPKGRQSLPAPTAKTAKAQSLKSDASKVRQRKTSTAPKSQNVSSEPHPVNGNQTSNLEGNKSQVSPTHFQPPETETLSSLTTSPPFKGESETGVETNSAGLASI